MPSIDRRRRRRPIASILLVALAVVIVLALLIGGALRVGKASGPYWQDVNRSYASQGSTLVEQSNQAGTELTTLMGDMPTLRRDPLQEQLDNLVAASSRISESGAGLSPPTPSGALGKGFAGVLADRAEAVTELRNAVDGLLGMAPLPVVGAPTTTTTAPTALLTAGPVAADITSAGALLERSDRAYASVRRQFRSAPGRATLPPSIWVKDSQLWAAGPVQTLVEGVSGSSSLASLHQVVLLTNGIQLSPAAVPPIGSAPPAGTSTILPTHRLAVTAVVANQGNVNEPKVTASAEIRPQGAGVPASGARSFSLVAGGSLAVTFPLLKVTPGDTYVLTVSVTPPAGQTGRAATSQSFTIKVAPAYTPPSTVAS